MKRITPLFILTILIFTSCSTLVNNQLKNMGVYDEKSKVFHWSNGEKELTFIGMHHVGKKEFYDDVALKIDSLQKQGYVVFYEALTKDGIDSISLDRYARKHRKLLGQIVSYLDTTNNMLLGKYKLKGDYRFISQPAYDKINVDTNVAINADINLKVLVDAYEEKYGTVQLDDCDLQTPLKEIDYKCSKVKLKLREKYRYEFVLNLRNQHLAEIISGSSHEKVLVVYGRRHVNGLLDELRKIDSDWQITRYRNSN